MSFCHNFESILLCRNYQGQLITEKGKATKSGEKVIITIKMTIRWYAATCVTSASHCISINIRIRINISIVSALHQQQCNQTDYLIPGWPFRWHPLPVELGQAEPGGEVHHQARRLRRECRQIRHQALRRHLLWHQNLRGLIAKLSPYILQIALYSPCCQFVGLNKTINKGQT